MKRILAFILAMCLISTLAACSSTEKTRGFGSRLVLDESTAPSTDEVPTETTAATEATDPASTIPVNEPTDKNYGPAYDDLIDDYADLINYRFSASYDSGNKRNFPGISDTLSRAISDPSEYRWDSMVSELQMKSGATTPSYYGYILNDLNADGIPELFWVRDDHSIVAVFTYHEGSVYFLTAFWSRSRGFVSSNNTLYTHGSNGAASSSFCVYTLSKGRLYESYDSQEQSGAYPYDNSQYWYSLPINTLPESEPDNSFTVYIHRGSFPVRAACRYGEPAIGTVGQAGTYTIVEEYRNEIGLRFGKLKSGVGWIDLSRLEREQSASEIIFAAEMNASEIGNRSYYQVSAQNALDLRYIELIPSKTLKNISIYTLKQENGDPTNPELMHINNWPAGEPIIVSLSFYLTKIYGISATQNNDTLYFNLQPSYSGESRYYRVSSYTPANTGNSNLAPWQAAYLDYLNTLGDAKKSFDYRLVYVDSDDIPELFISGACEADGSIICSYKGGEVVTTHLRRLGGASYIPYSGLVHNCNGNMGYYTTDIYRLTDSGFVSLFWGEEEQSYETVTNEAGQEETISRSSFYIGSERTEVSEEDYLAAQAEIFDSSAAERLYIYNDSRMLSYTSIRERIRNW